MLYPFYIFSKVGLGSTASLQVTQVSRNKEVWGASKVSVNFQSTEQLNSNMMDLPQIIVCYILMCQIILLYSDVTQN
jgi:hypothetical protein